MNVANAIISSLLNMVLVSVLPVFVFFAYLQSRNGVRRKWGRAKKAFGPTGHILATMIQKACGC
jgi:hypothetical protein